MLASSKRGLYVLQGEPRPKSFRRTSSLLQRELLYTGQAKFCTMAHGGPVTTVLLSCNTDMIGSAYCWFMTDRERIPLHFSCTNSRGIERKSIHFLFQFTHWFISQLQFRIFFPLRRIQTTHYYLLPKFTVRGARRPSLRLGENGNRSTHSGHKQPLLVATLSVYTTRLQPSTTRNATHGDQIR